MHFFFANPPFKRKSRVFSSEICHLSESHVFSSRKSPILAKITRFLIRNPPFKQISRVFSSEIPHLSENHEFSPRKSPIYANITGFFLENTPFKLISCVFSSEIPPFKQKSLVFFSEIALLIGYHVIYLRESPI